MRKTLLFLNSLMLGALLLGAFTLSARAAHLVFLIGEDEYHTWETLPEFAKKDLEPLGHRITIIQADAADKNHFPGIVEALRDADLLFVSVRRRTPPVAELDAVRTFVALGKPVVGIRTASHAFSLPLKTTLTDPKLAVWPEFDAAVLGGHYTGHHGKDKVAVTFAPGAEAHPILAGIAAGALLGNGGLYKNTPLEKDATPLLIGTIPDEPSEPVAWTHLHGAKQGRVFYTSLGHPDDFQNPAFRRLLLNGIAWALGAGK
jgi:type 1 glutamine amidotransferase